MILIKIFRTRFYLLIFPFIFSFMVFSCKTGEPSDVSIAPFDQEEQIDSQINQLLREEKPAEALQWIHYYKTEGAENDLQQMEEQALAALVQKYQDALEDRNYPRAISIYQSFLILGKTAVLPEGQDLEDLKTDYLVYLAGIERTGAAAGLITSGYGELSRLEDLELANLARKLTKGENRKALSLVVEEIKTRQLPLDDQTLSFLERKVSMEDLLKGTVTVWVDKGLKIERGVGYPDRVIGSGFFIDKNGYLLTNYHVIASEVDPEYQGHSRLFVKLSDDRGEKIPAKVVGWDRHFDLALLKIEIDAPYVFSFSTDDQYSLGQQIFAIGSPGGLNNSITSGTVSAVRRPLLTMGETVQIDVPINPGNSGGPLLSQEGRVKGVIFAGIEEFEGINFAINGSYVKRFLPSLYEGGALVHPWAGIGGYQEFDFLETLYVVPESPAGMAGLEREDKILSINGNVVSRNQDARDIILGMEPGTIVNLAWEHKGEKVESFLSLQERPDIPLGYAIKNDDRISLFPPLFGMVLDRVKKEQYQVRKVYTGSYADEASISANDIITLKKWMVNEKDGYVLIQFIFKGVKAGYLESAIQLGSGLESTIFF